MSKIFGIDLGTTYSCIAYVDEYGKPVTVTNVDNNSPVTPSVVYFESPDSIIVGEFAKNALSESPELVCSTIKRMIGSKDFTFDAHGRKHRPEDVSSQILRKLALDAYDKLGEEVKDVVITCPAYFGIEQRNATKKAGEIAGLNVISIINEPTAAAISYGLKEDEPQTVMVYDLGGGTFDVTIIKVEPGDIEVVATGGDHNLGGKNWDEKIREMVIRKHVEETGANEDDIYDNSIIMGDLEVKCEIAKKQLSRSEKATIRLAQSRIEITKEQFEESSVELLESSVLKTRQTMEEAAKKGVNDVDKILLVGGSTFMPQVKARLEQEFPNKPIEFCDPNESVARGAALYGANVEAFKTLEKMAEETGKDVEEIIEEQKKTGFALPSGVTRTTRLRNVVSKSYAIELQDTDDQLKLFNFIFVNTSLPLEMPVGCATSVPNQKSAKLSVYENNYTLGSTERDIIPYEDATLLMSDELSPLPDNLPAGAPIEIILKIDEQGLFSVDAKDVTGGRTVHMEVQLDNTMTDEEVAESKAYFDGIKLR